MRLQGGSISYAVFLAFIVFGLCSSFILYTHFNRSIIQENDYHLCQLINLNSALQLSLSSEFEYTDARGTNIKLFDDAASSFRIYKDHWALYDYVSVKNLNKSIYSEKSALVGTEVSFQNDLALYMSDHNKPLSLAGNTRIEGSCILPKAGLKRAYIEGQNYNGELPKVSETHSKKNLPKLNSHLIDHLKNLLDSESIFDSIVGPEIFEEDKIHNSWINKTLVISSTQPISLIEREIKGKIIIHSEQKISVVDSRLDGVIIVAPVIEIMDQRKGNLQALVTDSLILNGRSQLKYPSSLSLIDQDLDNSIQATISVSDNSLLEGDVLIYSENANAKKQALLEIGPSSKITGQIYINGLVDCKGTIEGVLYCDGFLLKTPSSIYRNHLLNTRISRNKLPSNYISSNLFNQSNTSIVRCLN